MFREVTSVSHISLKTDLTDYRERCWKTIPCRVDPVERYRTPLLKDSWKSLSSPSCTRERSLSFTYGRPDESCSSFTLMYFGKWRANRINLLWSR